MTKKKKIVLMVIVFFAFLITVTGYYLFLAPKLSQTTDTGTVPDSLAWKFPTSFLKLPLAGLGVPVSSSYSTIPVGGGVSQGLPVRLEIPTIGVDSFIEDAYITPGGAMEVPSGTVDVAWFALGPHPGQVGSAVVGGHFGIQKDVPFVFYNLSKLKIGDNVYVVDDEGNTIKFVVNSTSLFAANADATNVFTSSDGLAHLNLITCEGIWNEVAGEYPSRTVVFTTEVSSNKTTAPATALSVSTFPRLLKLGTSGVDVSALQVALEQKGFLTLPPAVATGIFSSTTTAALSAYQQSVGLPADGIFGSLTRAKLISDLAVNSVLPYAGLANATNLSLSQKIIQFIESLYATKTDGLITSLLILALIFLAVKIVLALRTI